jgi:putative thioredoxin
MSSPNPGSPASATPAPATRPVGAASFATDVLERSRAVPVLVDFWAAWCGPCRAIAPVLERLAREYAGRLDVAKLDTDAEPAIASRYGIRSLPTLALFRNGAILDTVIGAQPEAVLRRLIESHLEQPTDREREAALAIARAGDPEAAIATLEHLALAEPDRPLHRLALIDVLIGAGRLEAADERLARLPASLAAEPEVATRRARLELARLARAAPSADPLARTHRAAAQDFLAGREREAIDGWLSILRVRPDFGGGTVLAALRAAFRVLGSEHALVRAARREMAALVH